MLFNGIWTGFFVTPYLAMAPVHFFKLAYRVVVPALETSTLILWLVGVILLGIDLPSSGQCVDPGCKAALAAVVLAALEWYVLTLPFHALESYSRTADHKICRIDMRDKESLT